MDGSDRSPPGPLRRKCCTPGERSRTSARVRPEPPRTARPIESPGRYIRTFVDPTNLTRVAVLMDVPDMDAVMAAMESTAAADAMAYDGVLPETLVLLVEASPRA